MELAKNLAQWQNMTPDQWLTQANRALPPIVVFLLVILIAARAADVTWRLLEAPAEQDSVPTAMRISPSSGSSEGSLTSSLDALVGWRPFGQPPALDPDALAGIPFPDDAPETTLALILSGVLEVQDVPEAGEIFTPENGSAIIASGRQQHQTYRTGETIEGASGATLYAVFSDYVMLDRGGRYETLRFPPLEESVRSGVRLNSQVNTAPARPNTQTPLSSEVPNAESLSAVAAILSQHVTIAPQRDSEGGRNIGFRLQPSGNGQVFSQLGLEPGDVLTEVNGVSLANGANALRVVQALTESPQASVVILRNGAQQPKTLDIGQIQRLAESLQ